MAKPMFQFRLKNGVNYYYVDSSGTVTTSTTPQNLQKAFPDWKNLQMQWKRSAIYHGVFRQFAPEAVTFANDAAKILRYLFNTQGDTEAFCELEVYKLRTTDLLYYHRVTCKVNFAKYSNALHTVGVALVEGGLVAKLRAFDGTDYPIALGEPGTDPDTEWIWISGDPPGADPGGVMLLGNYHYQTQGDGAAFIRVNAGSAGGGTMAEACLGVVSIDREGAYGVISAGSPLANGLLGVTPIEQAHIGNAIENFTGTLTGSVNFTHITNHFSSDDNMSLEIHAKVYNGSWAATPTDFLLWADPVTSVTPGSSSGTASAAFTPFTHTFAKGDFLIIALRVITDTAMTGADTSDMSILVASEATSIDLAFQFRQEDSPARALTHWQLFRKMFHALTNQTAIDPISNLLTTDVYPGPDVYNLNPFNTFVTCGDALRQLYVDADGNPKDPEIKTNFKDMNKDLLTTLGAGIGIELDGSGNEVLRCETLDHFYQKAILIKDLGNKITNWRMTPYDEWKANNIKAGHRDIKYDEVNGRFDFNSETNYQSTVESLKKDIDYVTPFHHSPYDIEYVRANLANKPTTDSGSDNETFKIQSNGNQMVIAGYATNPYQVDKAQTITAGIPTDVQPTLFNIMFSPARNMARCSKWLKSIYFNLTSPILTFMTGKKNTALVSSMYTGPTVTENANMDLTPDGTGDDILFKPYVFEFEAQVPIDLPALMEANPYGVFGHTVTRDNTGHYLEGFALEVGITDATNNVFNFALLCSPNTTIPADF